MAAVTICSDFRAQESKEVHQAVYCHPAYLTYMQVHHVKCWAG